MMMMMVRVSVKIRSLMSSRLLAGEMLLLYLGEYFRSCRIDAVVVVRFSISVYVHVTVNSAVDTHSSAGISFSPVNSQSLFSLDCLSSSFLPEGFADKTERRRERDGEEQSVGEEDKNV